MGSLVFVSLWRIEYKNQYVTHTYILLSEKIFFRPMAFGSMPVRLSVYLWTTFSTINNFLKRFKCYYFILIGRKCHGQLFQKNTVVLKWNIFNPNMTPDFWLLGSTLIFFGVFSGAPNWCGLHFRKTFSLSVNGSSLNSGPNCSVFVLGIISKDVIEILQAYGVQWLDQIGVDQFLEKTHIVW